MRYQVIDLDGYSETGAGGAGFTVEDEVSVTWAAQLGLRGVTSFNTSHQQLSWHLLYDYEFENNAPTLNARFIGGPDNPFRILTGDRDDQGLRFGLDWQYHHQSGANFSLGYDGYLLNESYVHHQLQGRVNWVF